MLMNALLLFSVVSILSVGQVFFKLTANRLPDQFSFGTVASIIGDFRFIFALCFYCAGTLLWIFALKRMPLTVAYPFVALSFIVTPILASIFLDERLSLANGLGGLLIISGVLVIANWGGAV